MGTDGGIFNSFIKSLEDQGHGVYAGMDAMFIDAILQGGLFPNSATGWNIYIDMRKSDKGDHDIASGRSPGYV